MSASAEPIRKTELTPRAIVTELDRHIIGQDAAKRAVAIALRNRWRRMQVPVEARADIVPKNILMIGPTGVGKTEIARRLAKLAGAPFIKVEATKYTEVGYVGKDVESIIRELMSVAMKMVAEESFTAHKAEAEDAAEEQILDALLPQPTATAAEKSANRARQELRKMLREHRLDDKEVEIRVPDQSPSVNVIGGNAALEDVSNQLQSLFDQFNRQRYVSKRMTVKNAYRILTKDAAAKLDKPEELKQRAVDLAENHGIVFIDEIDKICQDTRNAGDVSRQGVQRDLLPLIEGSTVNTKFGTVKTDHMLFIASGAFQMSKPSDLIPELQGRLPIRVELKALTVDDFERILTEPHNCLTVQYELLLATEGVTLKFTPDAVKRIAEDAYLVNERTENIGARRLHTLMEKILDDISYEASERPGDTVTVDAAYVDAHVKDLVKDDDQSRYIL